MTDSLNDIRRLLPVLEMAFQAQQARMSRITQRIDVLRQQMRDIDRPRVQENHTLSPATRVGADIRWKSWAEDRKKIINQELAIAMRDKEAVRGAMTSALSKLEAAKRIEESALFEVRRKADRRSSW